MAEVKKPEKPGYPGRYNAGQTIWLAMLLTLLGFAIISERWRDCGFMVFAIASFYISRIGLIDRPKEEKKP